MGKSIGIVGAGLIGRMLGVELGRRGWEVTLFDRDSEEGTRSCTWASAGMIAPSSELESAEPEVALMGTAALKRWPELAASLDGPVDLRQEGSLIVAHPADRRELLRLKEKVLRGAPDSAFMRELTEEEVHALEPEVNPRFTEGLYMTFEGQVDNRKVMRVLAATLHSQGATWHANTEVTQVEPGRVHRGGETHSFDWVADCRGLGAQPDLSTLRGIRGELVYLSAPEVTLSRPVRLMHPRYPIYIVPREEQMFVVGATAIESQDDGPVTVRSVLELLSAAYTVHTGFAEARLIETVVGLRPAFPDNRPRILYRDGLLRINGLYRHGFLLSPVLSRLACDFLEGGGVPGDDPGVFEEAS